MNKIVSLALLIGGVALMVIGINATDSFGSDVSRFFTGSPTDKAIWMLIGGTVAAIIGLSVAQLETGLSKHCAGRSKQTVNRSTP
jgi:uncharacterized membrane protein